VNLFCIVPCPPYFGGQGGKLVPLEFQQDGGLAHHLIKSELRCPYLLRTCPKTATESVILTGFAGKNISASPARKNIHISGAIIAIQSLGDSPNTSNCNS
jgi:hypothetical protein